MIISRHWQSCAVPVCCVKCCNTLNHQNKQHRECVDLVHLLLHSQTCDACENNTMTTFLHVCLRREGERERERRGKRERGLYSPKGLVVLQVCSRALPAAHWVAYLLLALSCQTAASYQVARSPITLCNVWSLEAVGKINRERKRERLFHTH